MLDDVANLSQKEMQSFIEEMKKNLKPLPNQIDADPEKIENGLAKLVLTVIELIRKLLEKEVIRRMGNETLTDDEIERLGNALIRLEEKMDELKHIFGLEDEELNLDLGPLGNLL